MKNWWEIYLFHTNRSLIRRFQTKCDPFEIANSSTKNGKRIKICYVMLCYVFF